MLTFHGSPKLPDWWGYSKCCLLCPFLYIHFCSLGTGQLPRIFCRAGSIFWLHSSYWKYKTCKYRIIIFMLNQMQRSKYTSTSTVSCRQITLLDNLMVIWIEWFLMLICIIINLSLLFLSYFRTRIMILWRTSLKPMWRSLSKWQSLAVRRSRSEMLW